MMLRLKDIVDRSKVEEYIVMKGYDYYRQDKLPRLQKPYLENARKRAKKIDEICSQYTKQDIEPKVLSFILSEIKFRSYLRQKQG